MEPVNIETWEGITYSDQFALTDQEGTPFDLTGWTATANLYLGTPDNPPASASLVVSTANGKLVVDSPATGGLITRTLSASVMTALLPGDYWWECILTKTATGATERPAWGFWQHKPTGL